MSHYTSWAHHGPFSRLIGSWLKPLQPPVLVLSLPRSGSSWVGETLGASDDAMYLREPINQSYISSLHGKERETVFDINLHNPPEIYLKAAQVAFLGIPSFPHGIVHSPKQWQLRFRRSRRVVIKEINPLACEFFLQYRPKVILLVRHPAGVLRSYQQLGWQSTGLKICRAHGYHQGRVLRAALDSMKDYISRHICLYEELCAVPVPEFKRMFDFTGLVWNRKVETHIQEHSISGDRSDLWSTRRDSQSMIQEWRGHFSSEELDELRKGFQEFDLPWYRAEKDW